MYIYYNQTVRLWIPFAAERENVRILISYIIVICSGLSASALALTEPPLTDCVKVAAPWRDMAANSEQRQPVYLGATPAEIEAGAVIPAGGQVPMPQILRDIGVKQGRLVYGGLEKSNLVKNSAGVEFEVWPARDDDGKLTWAFARWRSSDGGWNWLDSKMIDDQKAVAPDPFLPVSVNARPAGEGAQIFGDILQFKGLYSKPLFGDCVWTDEAGGVIYGAWNDTGRRESYERELALSGSKQVCRVIPQPARLYGKPVSFRLKVSAQAVVWPPEISWETEAAAPAPGAGRAIINNWPGDFNSAYKRDVMMLSGAKPAVFPLSKRKMAFTLKNNIQQDSQLDDIADYLQERYRALGIRTERMRFMWRGREHSNVIAVIPGSQPDSPVLMADHYDTAFCEDVFDRNGERVSAPGADDNGSATAALLRAAVILRDARLRRDIWLVHLTGEEFPADDLGAREFVSRSLKNRGAITGLVLLDMIGHREQGTKIFQINSGEGPEAEKIAFTAMNAAHSVSRQFTPVLRKRFDEKSYLYNTDGLIFSDAGYPVVLFNEHINKLENFNRKGYHDTLDTVDNIDWEYASVIAKAAIETVARLAGASGGN